MPVGLYFAYCLSWHVVVYFVDLLVVGLLNRLGTWGRRFISQQSSCFVPRHLMPKLTYGRAEKTLASIV